MILRRPSWLDRAVQQRPQARAEAAGAGACVGDAAPNTGTLDQAFVALHVRLVLRPLEVVRALPARLRAAEGLEVPFDLDAFGGEETFLRGDEIVESHGLGGDADFAHGSSC